MALQSSTGYVRIAISTGYDETSLNVSWLTFTSTDWKESNPFKVWDGIEMQGSYDFDLAIKDEKELITGYHSQSREQAEKMLRALSVKGADFASVNFYTGEEEIPEEITALWKPDIKVKEGEKYKFYTDAWNTYVVKKGQDHATQLNWTPDRATTLWELYVEDVTPSDEILPWLAIDPKTGDYKRYQVDEKVSHKTKNWINTFANNTYEPGVYGWNELLIDTKIK